MEINPKTTTKSNKPRKGKANITHARYILRKRFWIPVKTLLQAHLAQSPKGEAKRMARACGINASQIHRFTCPKCEHDQEPCFTIGAALLLYMGCQLAYPVIEIPKPTKPKKTKQNANQRNTYPYHGLKPKEQQ